MHAIIVDDDAAFRKILERRLKGINSNIKILTFENLTSLRAYLHQNPELEVDIVVLDQNLPDGNGVDFLNEGYFRDLAVLVMSSDDSPDVAGRSVGAGASYFLNKRSFNEALFLPLVKGIIDRNKLLKEVTEIKIRNAKLETVKSLVATLKHEINNPLGAIIGSTFILKKLKKKTEEALSDAEREKQDNISKAIKSVEESGTRIKNVLDQLCKAVLIEGEEKAGHDLMHVPGDKKWE